MSDDNQDDDAQLQQLRAVWVTMRDEEPSDRGLAALMSAARSKASELEKAAAPSWWQRVAATLRRPQVLALATVTLLLGGALVVTQRSSEMKVDDARVEQTTAPAAPMAETQDNGAPVGGAAGSAASAPVLEQDVAKSADAVTERQGPRDAKPATKGRARAPATPTQPASAPEATGASATAGKGSRSEGFAGGQPGLVIAQDDAESAAPTPAPKKPVARTAPPSIEGEDRVVSKDAAPPTIDQLVKQCETAAARGDCAAARTIAQKILTTAPAAYKTRVANNATITRCFPAASEPTITSE